MSADVRHELRQYPLLMQQLLIARGITSAADAEVFLRPDYERDIHDPFLLDGMDVATARIKEAIDKQETIAIYHDYDMDGIPGAVVLHDCFKNLGHTQIVLYVPHRNRDGFGLHKAALDTLHKDGVTLIITVDCGITGVAEVAYANKLGIDVIITDHHLPAGDAELPDALAIINPNKGTCGYPNKDLCGAGVAWQLARALGAGNEKWMLDMVGAATLSDMVRLTGENRALTHFGLKVLRKSNRHGLVALCKKTGIAQSYLSEEDLTFMIAPRINAASRMDNPELARDILLADTPEAAHKGAEALEHLNNSRKGTVAGMLRDAHRRLADRGELSPVIVIGDPEWLPGLAGLVANTLSEELDRPVFVYGGASEDPSVLKGSCRGNGAIDVVRLMDAVADVWREYGGHTHSGGFGIDKEHIHTLEDVLSKHVLDASIETAAETDRTDLELTLDSVNWDTYRQIEQFGPFGVGNPKPVILLQQVIPKTITNFGKEKNHLKLSFDAVEAIGFFMTREQFSLEDNTALTLLAHMEQSFFRGKPELRLRIVDIVS